MRRRKALTVHLGSPSDGAVVGKNTLARVEVVLVVVESSAAKESERREHCNGLKGIVTRDLPNKGVRRRCANESSNSTSSAGVVRSVDKGTERAVGLDDAVSGGVEEELNVGLDSALGRGARSSSGASEDTFVADRADGVDCEKREGEARRVSDERATAARPQRRTSGVVSVVGTKRGTSRGGDTVTGRREVLSRLAVKREEYASVSDRWRVGGLAKLPHTR